MCFSPWPLISKDSALDGRFGIALPFHREEFGSERLDEGWVPFDANAGVVRNRPVFMGAFVDAFHEATFVLVFKG